MPWSAKELTTIAPKKVPHVFLHEILGSDDIPMLWVWFWENDPLSNLDMYRIPYDAYAYPSLFQALNYCEFFAGQANVWRAVSEVYPAARVDLDYSDPTYVEKMNPMNFLSSPGFASLDFSHWDKYTFHSKTTSILIY